MADHIDGDMVRRHFEEYVQWIPRWVPDAGLSWDYCVLKYAFVPGFHLVEYKEDEGLYIYDEVVSTHKTLHEAMGICRILLANGGAHE